MRPPVRRGPIFVAGAHVQGLFMQIEAPVGEGETVLGWGYTEPFDGGKASNQALAASRLGGWVRLLTAIGDDERGHRALRRLHDEGVDVTWVQVLEDRSTDVGFVMLPPSGVPLIVSAQDLSRCLDRDRIRTAREAIAESCLVVSQLEAPVDGVIETFRLARQAEVATIFNPSPMRELPCDLMNLVDLLVLNEHEAAALIEAPAEPPRQAARLVERWPHCAVVLTAGPLGAFVASGDAGVVHVPAPSVVANDTTGAGDVLLGAVATALSEGSELLDAVAFGVAAASLSVEREGSWPAFPTRAEVASLLAQDTSSGRNAHLNQGAAP